MKKWDAKAFASLLKIRGILEKHYRDVQDIEFTIERGHLWMLQTRNGKRTAAAAVKIAVDMVKEKLISRDEALLRIPAGDLVQLLLPSYTAASKKGATCIARGLPASPRSGLGRTCLHGRGSGRAVTGWREGLACPNRNITRRRRRHASCRRDPHQYRWNDIACCGRGQGMGQVLRRRGRRSCHRRPQATGHRQRQDLRTKGHSFHRRLDGRSARRSC